MFSGLSNSLYEHNVANFATYYDRTKPFIVELVAKGDLSGKVFENFSYLSDAIKEDNGQYLDGLFTFNKVIAYNSRQSTGTLNLTVKPVNDPFASVGTFSPSGALVERVERNWRVNKLRNRVVQTSPEQSIFTSNWADTNYQTAYPIDKVPNVNVISGVNQFEMSKLRDKYMVVRLIYDDVANRDYTLVTKVAESKYETSRR